MVMKRFLLALGLTLSLTGLSFAQETKAGQPPAKTPPPPAKNEQPPAKPQTKPEQKPTPAPAAANAEVDLSWKFVKDKVFYQKLRTITEQKMKVQQTNVDQKQEQEFVFSWKVDEVDASKIVLTQKIEAVMMKINISNNEIKYDSQAKDAADNPLASFFKPLIGSSFTITLDPNTMKVIKVGGREEFVKKLTDANPQMKALLSSILSEEQLKQMSEPAFTLVPDKGKKVKPGDTWERATTMKMGPIGSYQANYKYTYDGPEVKDGKTLQKISMKTTLNYTKPDAKEASGLPFKITDGKLETREATGTIWFDNEAGRVADSTMDVKLKGTLKVTVSDQEADVELEQTQKTFTSTSDKNPLEAAAKVTQ